MSKKVTSSLGLICSVVGLIMVLMSNFNPIPWMLSSMFFVLTNLPEKK